MTHVLYLICVSYLLQIVWKTNKEKFKKCMTIKKLFEEYYV